MSVAITKKQHLLLQVMNNYRSKYGRPPTYQELAEFSRLEKKSVYRMIKILVSKGYLYRNQNGRKARGVLLTDHALEELGLFSYPKQFQVPVNKTFDYKNRSVLEKELVRNSVTVSSPSPDQISLGKNTIKTDSTNYTDLNTIVETVASILMGRVSNGTWSGLPDQSSSVNLTGIVDKKLIKKNTLHYYGWMIALVIGFSAFLKLTANPSLAFIFAAFSTVLINLMLSKD